MDDALDVLAWRNDPHTIAMSKTAQKVGEAEHLRWFAQALADQDRIILVAMDANRKLGMVRFDRMDRDWLVSINLAPEARGKGHGVAVLSAAIDEHRSTVGPSRIIAEIMEANEASVRLFAKCGFVKQMHRGGFWQMEFSSAPEPSRR